MNKIRIFVAYKVVVIKRNSEQKYLSDPCIVSTSSSLYFKYLLRFHLRSLLKMKDFGCCDYNYRDSIAIMQHKTYLFSLHGYSNRRRGVWSRRR